MSATMVVAAKPEPELELAAEEEVVIVAAAAVVLVAVG